MMTSHSEFTLKAWGGRRLDMEEAMYESYEGDRDDSPHRHHMGASDIGNVCSRHTFYTYRHALAKDFPPRLYKVFDTGHRAEPIIARDLRRIGVEIETENEDGVQFNFTAYGGHVTVNLDGIARIPDKVPVNFDTIWKRMIVEMKTMSLKRFKTMASKGVKEACPEYYRQMQMQLHVASLCGHEFDGAFFIALCKDNDEYYSVEVYHDDEMQKRLRKEVCGILKGDVPDRLAISEKMAPCRFCNYLKICKHDCLHLLERNCRTCDHAEMVLKSDNCTETTWSCKLGHQFGEVCDEWCQYIGF